MKMTINVPDDFFDKNQLLDAKINKALELGERRIKERFEQIRKFVIQNKQYDCSDITYEAFLKVFLKYYKEQLLNDAIENAIAGENEYSVMYNAMGLITWLHLDMAIYGTPMINAFIEVIEHHREKKMRFLPGVMRYDIIQLIKKEFS